MAPDEEVAGLEGCLTEKDQQQDNKNKSSTD
jgi:hypothetical protein